MSSYGVTIYKYSSLFRSVREVGDSKAQGFDSGRTEFRNFVLWICCMPKTLNIEKKMI